MRLFCIINILLLFVILINAHGKSKTDSLQMLLKNASEKEKPELLNAIAWEYYLFGQPDSSKFYLSKAKRLAISSDNINQIAYSSKIEGLLAMNSGNYTKAVNDMQQAHDLYKSLDENIEASKCYSNIGIIYAQQSKFDISIEYFKKGLELVKDSPGNNAVWYTNLGRAYEEQWLFDKAFNYYLLALKDDEAAGDSVGMAYDYNNLAGIYNYQEKKEKALEYYEMSYQLFNKSGRKMQIAIVCNNIGLIYLQKKKLNKAQDFLSKSLTFRKELKNPQLLAFAHNSLGELYLMKLKNDTAIYHFFAAQKLAQEINAKKTIAESQMNIGKIFKKTEKYDQALMNLNNALKIAEDNRYFELWAEILLHIAEINEQNRDFNAIKYYKKYNQIRDSLFNKKHQRRLKELQIKFETNQKEKKISFLKKENTLIVQQNRQKNLIIIITFVLFIIVLILGLLSYRLYNEKKVANRILQSQIAVINQQLKAKQTGLDQTHTKKEQIIDFSGEGSRDSFQISDSQLIYIVSQGNYVEIVWSDADKKQRKLIRNTMKNIERIVEKHDSIFRCHRSYFVNINKVKEVTGNTKNYKLHFKENIADEIPVSRNYSNQILEKIKIM